MSNEKIVLCVVICAFTSFWPNAAWHSASLKVAQSVERVFFGPAQSSSAQVPASRIHVRQELSKPPTYDTFELCTLYLRDTDRCLALGYLKSSFAALRR